MERQRFNYGNFLEGVVIGSVIAGVAMLFMAPQSGAMTRQMIQDKGIELRDQSVKTLDTARERIDNIISNTLHRTEQAANAVGEQAELLSHQM